MRSIAWLAEKGGTGKTTSAVNTAAGLAKLGRRVLVIDADPQGNATLVFLRGRPAEAPTLYHVLTGTADATEAIRGTGTPGLDLLPADDRLADANITLASELARERRLRTALRGVGESYDVVVIDTSPQRTLINVNVLNYATEVYCPVDPGIFSIAGLVKLQGVIADVAKFLDNAALRLAGLVLTRTQRDNLTRDVEAQIRETFGPLVCKTAIPASTKIGEAHARYLAVLDYARLSPAARAYEALTKEILEHGEEHGIGGDLDRAPSSDRAGRGARRATRAAG
ncbi:MAG TPA: ParA family protein [Isosphaeraceae bacterium]|nr:ParA family protein [Isosphaeraceae bacterium]